MKLKIEIQPEEACLEMAALVAMTDIIFQLIFFFIISASFDNVQFDREVLLPHLDAQTPIKSLPPERFILNVLNNGELRVGFTKISQDHIEKELPSILKQSIHNADTKIILNGDERTKHQYIARVMQAVASIGYNNVEINAAVGEQQ